MHSQAERKLGFALFYLKTFFVSTFFNEGCLWKTITIMKTKDKLYKSLSSVVILTTSSDVKIKIQIAMEKMQL